MQMISMNEDKQSLKTITKLKQTIKCKSRNCYQMPKYKFNSDISGSLLLVSAFDNNLW